MESGGGRGSDGSHTQAIIAAMSHVTDNCKLVCGKKQDDFPLSGNRGRRGKNRPRRRPFAPASRKLPFSASGNALQAAQPFPHPPDLPVQCDQESVAGYLHDGSEPVRSAHPVVDLDARGSLDLPGWVEGAVNFVAAFGISEFVPFHPLTPCIGPRRSMAPRKLPRVSGAMRPRCVPTAVVPEFIRSLEAAGKKGFPFFRPTEIRIRQESGRWTNTFLFLPRRFSHRNHRDCRPKIRHGFPVVLPRSP